MAGAKAPILGRQVSTCATILASVTLVRALVYCNILRETKLGGWGNEGLKGPTFGQYISVCASIPLGS